MAGGIVAKFDGCGIHDFAEARAWATRRFPEMAFTPEQVVAAAVPELEPEGYFDETGIYFLIRGGKICYIGKAREICRRVAQHKMQRRPFDAVAAIAGVHREFLDDLEAAYVNAWNPPWNAAPVYGYGHRKLLQPALDAMDRALICTLPEYQLTESELDSIMEKMNGLGL